MLAVADARSYLFTASQIIPTLLVALFVLDRRLTIPHETEAEKLEQDVNELGKVLEGEEVDYRETALHLLAFAIGVHWMRRALAETNLRDDAELIASLEGTRRRYAARSSRFAGMVEKLSITQKRYDDNVKRLAKVRKSMSRAHSLYRLQFATVVVGTAIAEGFALLGGVGIVGVYRAVAATLIVIGLTLLALIEFVFSRFFPGLDEAAWERQTVIALRVVLVIAFCIYVFMVMSSIE